ncbi:MAG: NADH-quinone oxidoreductase subunit J [Prevotellaceae bacterium]|jgi:NADH-quinone oxidoreductase subunit J|nr:NADH-quinone oxidoreductase subunit J [Prevotellaceae bacterium]
MEITSSQAAFAVLAAIIVICSVLSVTTKRILRSATYLMFVLFASAGIYLLLNYHFLAAVQAAIYAGGILILLIFSIFLTSRPGEKLIHIAASQRVMSALAALFGFAICTFVIVRSGLKIAASASGKIDMHVIGHALMGSEKFQYLLPFEAISILLLASIIGGILIARKR